MAARCLGRLAGRLAGRLSHRAVFRGGKSGNRLLHRETGVGINLRGGCLDRGSADLGLLYFADNSDGGRGHTQLRKAQRVLEEIQPSELGARTGTWRG
jgi:hypothetical protein